MRRGGISDGSVMDHRIGAQNQGGIVRMSHVVARYAPAMDTRAFALLDTYVFIMRIVGRGSVSDGSVVCLWCGVHYRCGVHQGGGVVRRRVGLIVAHDALGGYGVPVSIVACVGRSQEGAEGKDLEKKNKQKFIN